MNGWQRLWVVVCVLIGIVLMVVGEKLVPTKESIAEKFETPLALERKYLGEIKERKFDQDAFSQDFFGGTALQDTEARIRDLETRHQSELNSLWVDQLQIRGVIAGVWFAICLSLYFCGWVIGWIAQGFRPKRV